MKVSLVSVIWSLVLNVRNAYENANNGNETAYDICYNIYHQVIIFVQVPKVEYQCTIEYELEEDSLVELIEASLVINLGCTK